MRPVWAEVDLGAIAQNVAALRALAAPASLCAVVKADGYGHGSVPVARAALAGGADVLAVALVAEGVELREAGIDTVVLVLSQASDNELDELVAVDLDATVYTASGVAGLAAAAARAGRSADAPGARPPQGRHGHAPGRRPAGRGRRPGPGDRRRTRAREGFVY